MLQQIREIKSSCDKVVHFLTKGHILLQDYITFTLIPKVLRYSITHLVFFIRSLVNNVFSTLVNWFSRYVHRYLRIKLRYGHVSWRQCKNTN